jgi:hypothetical protein
VSKVMPADLHVATLLPLVAGCEIRGQDFIGDDCSQNCGLIQHASAPAEENRRQPFLESDI